VFQDEVVTAFVSSAWWPGNDANVIVIPNAHYEHVYAVPDAVLAAIQVLGKRIAIAMEASYGCDGTSFRQHNGPGADQEVWHYHLHVIPRFVGDRFYVRTYERYDTTVTQR
jgi:histidine triad (HIT) family protein